MRASGTLLRLARALADASPAGTSASRVQCAEQLGRAPRGVAPPCSGAAARPFAAAALAEEEHGLHGSDEEAELQQREWELGGQRTAHKLVTDRPRTLDDFDDIIAVLIRRRRSVAEL
jgi:hypothetical protein